MKPKTQAFFRISMGVIGTALIIGYFNNGYASFFMFGAGLCSFLYELNGMVRNEPKNK